MGNDSLPPNLVQPLFVNQSDKCMKRSSCFESPDPLQVLAFEKQFDLRIRNASRSFFAVVFRYNALITFDLRSRGDIVKRLASCDWGSVHIVLDFVVGRLNRRSREIRARRYVRHADSCSECRIKALTTNPKLWRVGLGPIYLFLTVSFRIKNPVRSPTAKDQL